MILDEPGWQLIDDFFLHEGQGRSESTARRYERIRSRLTEFLDLADMADSLGTHPATLLEAEREFHEHGAFWQLFGADELVCCLPAFLSDGWMPRSLGESRTQISLVGRLLTHLRRNQVLDFSVVRCAFWEAEAAVKAARDNVAARASTAKPDDWSTDIPARLRDQRSTDW